MSNNNTSIHDFDFSFICNYFKLLKRQGPGSPEATRKAVSFINELTDDAKIADIGCGTGGQTLFLADYVKGQITGIDLFSDFIEIFNENAVKANCADRVKGITGSMDNLPFQNEELDLIWSEGAIYNIGFERGMNEWNKYLKKGGFIAVSEASWFTSERPAEIEDFWMDAYPEISVIPTCIDKMERAGYTPTAHFILPENCWTEHYFAPQDEVRETFMKEHPNWVATTPLTRSLAPWTISRHSASAPTSWAWKSRLISLCSARLTIRGSRRIRTGSAPSRTAPSHSQRIHRRSIRTFTRSTSMPTWKASKRKSNALWICGSRRV